MIVEKRPRASNDGACGAWIGVDKGSTAATGLVCRSRLKPAAKIINRFFNELLTAQTT